MTLLQSFKSFALAVCCMASLFMAAAANAERYLLPPDGQSVIGSVTTVNSVGADTLVDIARRHGLGYNDIVRANPDVDPWLPGDGTTITLPTRFVLPDAPRRGVVLNLAEYRLYYYPPARAGEPAWVHTFPISIGRMDWETPLGRTSVIAKARRPSWYVPQSVHQERADNGDPPLPRVVPPGPDNPLGERAMRLGLPGYLIHGTNRPAGVGMRVTHGCIRMFPEDIAYLFEQIPVGTAVNIVNQPVKFGWLNNELYLESHEPLKISAATENAEGELVEVPPAEALAGVDGAIVTAMTRAFVKATRERGVRPDWPEMESLLNRSTGIPTRVAELRHDASAD